MAPLSRRVIKHSVIAAAVVMRRACAAKHPSPAEVARTEDCHNSFLSVLGVNGKFDLAFN
jgi:hypothetical protein